ncbi:MAG: discoidin domain-containing protein [Bacteroidales bacterium]|nr:discoidin domain-containing protein [Bacteroidales bacterium]
MKLNGKNHTKTFISHDDILKGGTLEFAMSATPNKELGKKAEDRPVARITDNIIKVSDFLEYEGTGTFTGELEVSRYIIDDNYKAKKIETRYIGNNSPKDQTYNLNQESKFNGTREYSAVFYKIPEGRSIKILTNYSPQYTAGGDNALIDLKRGSDNWRIGCWQGYWGEDVEAVIDLGEKKEVKKIGGHFMQDQKAWIFAPIKVEYYVSDDGENFTLVETVNSPIPEKADGAIPHIFYTSKPFMARYVKMKAVNRKVNPEWHLSPGEKSWLFIDEIEIDAE